MGKVYGLPQEQGSRVAKGGGSGNTAMQQQRDTINSQFHRMKKLPLRAVMGLVRILQNAITCRTFVFFWLKIFFWLKNFLWLRNFFWLRIQNFSLLGNFEAGTLTFMRQKTIVRIPEKTTTVGTRCQVLIAHSKVSRGPESSLILHQML